MLLCQKRIAMQISVLHIFYGLIIFINYQLSRCNASLSKCDRIPENSTVNKSPVDGRYKLRILGDPEKYIPGENYTSKYACLLLLSPNPHHCATKTTRKFSENSQNPKKMFNKINLNVVISCGNGTLM